MFQQGHLRLIDKCGLFMYNFFFLLKISRCGLYIGVLYSPEFTVHVAFASRPYLDTANPIFHMTVTSVLYLRQSHKQ